MELEEEESVVELEVNMITTNQTWLPEKVRGMVAEEAVLAVVMDSEMTQILIFFKFLINIAIDKFSKN